MLNTTIRRNEFGCADSARCSFGGLQKRAVSADQFRPIVKASSFGAMLERAVSADQVFYRNKLKKDYIFSFDLP